MSFSELNRSTFPLPVLGPVLERLSVEVHEGRGFFILKGHDPKVYSREENVIIYLGISSYIGERRGRQTQYGSMLSERAIDPLLWLLCG